MKQCINCGKDILDSTKNCPYCGAKQEIEVRREEPKSVPEPEVKKAQEMEIKPEVKIIPEVEVKSEVPATPEIVPEPEVSAEPEIVAKAEVPAEQEIVPELEVMAEPEMKPEPAPVSSTPKFCIFCGNPLEEDCNFCPGCGHAVNAKPETAEKMVSPAKTVKTAKTGNPAKAVKTAKTANTGKTVSPAKTGNPAKALNSAKTINPAKAVNPTKAIKTAKAVNPAQTVNPAKNTKTSEASKEKSAQAAKFISENMEKVKKAATQAASSETMTGLKNIYIIEFFRKLLRTSNTSVLIYLLLNVGIIVTVFSLMGMTVPQAVATGLLLYILGLTVALSPIGEFILRFQTGCRRIKKEEEYNYIMPLFTEVYEKARAKDPAIPKDVKLFMNKDMDPNAFATGRKTVCVTRGLLKLPPAQVKAVLSHEFGHLAHKDTDLILLISVGNFFISGMILIFRIILNMFSLMTWILSFFNNWVVSVMLWLTSFFTDLFDIIFVSGLTWLWTKLGILLVMKSTRDNEYEADAFAYQMGWGDDLCVCLADIAGGSQRGLFANLASSHPDTSDRIDRLCSMGANYSTIYREN